VSEQAIPQCACDQLEPVSSHSFDTVHRPVRPLLHALHAARSRCSGARPGGTGGVAVANPTQSVASPFCPAHRIRLVHLIPPPETVWICSSLVGRRKVALLWVGWGLAVEKQIALDRAVRCSAPLRGALGPVRQGRAWSGSKSKPNRAWAWSRRLVSSSHRTAASSPLALVHCIGFILLDHHHPQRPHARTPARQGRQRPLPLLSFLVITEGLGHALFAAITSLRSLCPHHNTVPTSRCRRPI
jgi:hypothetical protein